MPGRHDAYTPPSPAKSSQTHAVPAQVHGAASRGDPPRNRDGDDRDWCETSSPAAVTLGARPAPMRSRRGGPALLAAVVAVPAVLRTTTRFPSPRSWSAPTGPDGRCRATTSGCRSSTRASRPTSARRAGRTAASSPLLGTLGRAQHGAPALRIGGNSADITAWDPSGAPQRPPINAELGRPFLGSVRAVETHLRAPLMLALDLASRSGRPMRWPSHEPRRRRCPAGTLRALEIGNRARPLYGRLATTTRGVLGRRASPPCVTTVRGSTWPSRRAGTRACSRRRAGATRRTLWSARSPARPVGRLGTPAGAPHASRRGPGQHPRLSAPGVHRGVARPRRRRPAAVGLGVAWPRPEGRRADPARRGGPGRSHARRRDELGDLWRARGRERHVRLRALVGRHAVRAAAGRRVRRGAVHAPPPRHPGASARPAPRSRCRLPSSLGPSVPCHRRRHPPRSARQLLERVVQVQVPAQTQCDNPKRRLRRRALWIGGTSLGARVPPSTGPPSSACSGLSERCEDMSRRRVHPAARANGLYKSENIRELGVDGSRCPEDEGSCQSARCHGVRAAPLARRDTQRAEATTVLRVGPQSVSLQGAF